MYYIPNVLSKRKKGKLAKIWLAAILNERLFKQIVSNKVVILIRVDDACEQILSTINMANSQKGQRYSLYLSSQLMYGLAKILKYQTVILIGEVYNIFQQTKSLSARVRNEADKENWPNNINLPNDLPSPPRTKGIRKNLITDFHLMPDIDMSRLKLNQEVAQFTSPSFGELSSEQVDFFLRNDDWSKDMIVDMTSVNFDQPVRLGDHSNKDQSDEPAHVELQDELPPFTEESTEQRRSTRMSNKREMPEPNLDTPSKRKRKSIIQPDITHQSDMEISPKGRDEQFPEQVTVDPVDIPASPEKSAKSPEKNIETMFGELVLDSLISPEKPMRSKKKKNVKLIDEFTKIHGSVFDEQIKKVRAHTTSFHPNVTAPRLRIPAPSLLEIPSTCYRTTPEDWMRKGCRYSFWASEINQIFESKTVGPFSADDDVSFDIEPLRPIDSQIQSEIDVSSGLGKNLQSSSSRDKTKEESIQYAVAPQITGDETHEPTMEIDIQDIPNESINLHDTCSRTTVGREDASDKMPAGSKSKTSTDRSHLSSEDLNAFLPPKAKVSKIEISQEPSISSSRESSLPNPWSKPELLIHLSLLWDNCSHGCQVLKFSDIVSPDSASELEAATCFSLLLEMHQEGLIKLAQRECYDEIYIYPANVL